jgi:hypothetical protein
MVLRGGYGMSTPRPTAALTFQTVPAPPFSSLRASIPGPGTATLAKPFGPVVSESDFPIFQTYSPTTSLGMNTVSPDYRPQLTQQWSLNLQTTFAKNFLWEVGYVGTRGTHLIRSRENNQADLASASNPIRGVTTNTLTNVNQRRPILGFGRLLVVESNGNSWYHGLETSVTKRFSHGLQFLASYTFARAFDSDGGFVSFTSSAAGSPGNQNDWRSRYGPSSFLRAQRLVLSYVYEMPSLRNGNAFAKTMLSGWSLAGVTTIQNGRTLTMTYTNANNAYGITSDRPSMASGCTYSQLAVDGSVTSKLNSYFNAKCLATPVVIGSDGKATDFGNSGIGIARGPAQQNFDMSLIKRTPLHEALNLEFRMEAFNVFNTPQFADPNTGYATAGFGQIVSTAVNPRILQFALKLNF